MTVQLKCSRCGNEWSAHSLAVAQGCRRCDPFPAALLPAESTTAEAFATVREALGYSGDSNTAFLKEEAAREALTLLERRMQASASLAALVEAFCEDVEASERAQEAKSRGGQQVPFHGPLCHLQPSVRGELRRWARDFRKALGELTSSKTHPEDVL